MEKVLHNVFNPCVSVLMYNISMPKHDDKKSMKEYIDYKLPHIAWFLENKYPEKWIFEKNNHYSDIICLQGLNRASYPPLQRITRGSSYVLASTSHHKQPDTHGTAIIFNSDVFEKKQIITCQEDDSVILATELNFKKKGQVCRLKKGISSKITTPSFWVFNVDFPETIEGKMKCCRKLKQMIDKHTDGKNFIITGNVFGSTISEFEQCRLELKHDVMWANCKYDIDMFNFVNRDCCRKYGYITNTNGGDELYALVNKRTFICATGYMLTRFEKGMDYTTFNEVAKQFPSPYVPIKILLRCDY